MTIPTTADVQRACTLLSSSALIRLITEIDDNGPIPSRALTRTLADLPAYHLRQTTDLARALGLVRVRPGVGLGLTTSGSHLADVYDVIARWARRHAHPAPVCDFPSRIQHTLALLAEAPAHTAACGSGLPAADAAPRAEVVANLAQPRDLLVQWLRSNPQVIQSVASESAA
ncbi:hypothetical protein [Streptomyces calvus]